MRHDLLVFMPREDSKSSVSYSMYVSGVKKGPAEYSSDGNSLKVTLDGKKTAVFFYYFSGFERAYVVTGWDDESSETRSTLPGVEGDLTVLFTAVGREFKSLKRTVLFLTKYSSDGVFKLPLSFWYRLCALIQGRKAGRSNIMHLLHRIKEDMEFYGKQNDTCTEVSL